SGVLIVLIALWMAWRTWHESQPHHHHDDHHHHNDHHDHAHHHDHTSPLVEEEWQDAQQRAHTQDINRRFNGKEVTTGQIALFGLHYGAADLPATETFRARRHAGVQFQCRTGAHSRRLWRNCRIKHETCGEALARL